jgi:CheY-like chemotaxis protein
VATKKTVTKPAAKAAGKSKTVAPKKVQKPKPAKSSAKPSAKAPVKALAKTPAKASQLSKGSKPSKASTTKASPKPGKPVLKTPPKANPPVTAKKTPAPEAAKVESAEELEAATPAAKPATIAKSKTARTTLDDLALDIDEKDELLEEEKRDLIKALRDDEDEPLETAFVPTDTSERYILVVDEEGQRRNETVSIVQQILPNAVVEVADDPEEAHEIMQEADFDTFVVNFLMPGYSASQFVKAVANHPDHPLLIGFAADKISDALDQRKGLKIIPLKRLFDLDVPADTATGKEKPGAED